eukprot:618519-Prymnesium_polylepis.1
MSSAASILAASCTFEVTTGASAFDASALIIITGVVGVSFARLRPHAQDVAHDVGLCLCIACVCGSTRASCAADRLLHLAA